MDELFGEVFEPVLKFYDSGYDFCETNTSVSIKTTLNINYIPNEAICTGIVIFLLTTATVLLCSCCYCCFFRSKSDLENMYDSTDSLNQLDLLAIEREYEEQILEQQLMQNRLFEDEEILVNNGLGPSGVENDDLLKANGISKENHDAPPPYTSLYD